MRFAFQLITYLLLACSAAAQLGNPGTLARLKGVTASGPSFPSSGLVYYNPFEEAAGNSRAASVDTAGFGSMTEQVGTVTQATGIKNNCAAFTSASGHYFTSANATGNALFGDSFSFCIWVYCTSLPAVDDVADLVIRLTTPDIFLLLQEGGGLLSVGDGGAEGPLGTLNTWHCIVGTLTISMGAATYQLFIDSVDGGDGPVCCGDAPTGDDFLGIAQPRFVPVFNGKLDEFAIWNRVLTQEEINTLWNGGTGTFGP